MAAGEGPVRVLIVEDHPVVRLGLRSAIESRPGLRVVAEADSAAAALDLHRVHHPDLVVLPLRLGGEFTGAALCRRLRDTTPAPRVLVYTAFNEPGDAAASFLAGAHSFVHKGEDTDRFLDAIRATTAGRRVWLVGAEHRGAARQVDASGLTAREHEVFGLMVQRLSNAQIARQLLIGLPTVKTHVRHILAKLGMASRRDLF